MISEFFLIVLKKKSINDPKMAKETITNKIPLKKSPEAAVKTTFSGTDVRRYRSAIPTGI